MEILRFVNKLLLSNSYIIHNEDESQVWIVDPGESDQLLDWVTSRRKSIKGILLTHYHIDHIYGVNDLRAAYKSSVVYAPKASQEGLFSPKLNGSLYLDDSYILNNTDIKYIDSGATINLWEKFGINVYDTRGHNDDCVSYHIGKALFTGDALIPGYKIHLKSKGAHKEDAMKTIEWILGYFEKGTMIYPGHHSPCPLGDVQIMQ